MYTTDDFLSQVDLSGVARDGRYADAEVLQMAYHQLISVVVPLILTLREEYYVASETQPVVRSLANYSIPYRALGLALREVKLIRSNTIVDLTRIDPTAVTTITEGVVSSFYP